MRRKGRPTYGKLVGDLGLEPDGDKEQLLRRVYARVPRDRKGTAEPTREDWFAGEKTTEAEIHSALPDASLRKISECVNLLKDGDLVSTGSGRSRSVWRKLWKYSKEHDLYPPMRTEIRWRWADTKPHDFVEPDRFCAVVATHGDKRGRWGAPDITLIGGKTLPFLPGKFLDVVTFEVKPQLDITGLYEALSHRTHATYAYLICHLTREATTDEVARFTREGVRTGIGVILARQPEDYATWEQLVPATRWTPDPEQLHEFIVDITKKDRKVFRDLRAWLRREPFYGDRAQVNFSDPDLGLSEEDQQIAEDIYLEILWNKKVGWKHFESWIPKADVERVRERLKKAGIIRVVQSGGMRLPDS